MRCFYRAPRPSVVLVLLLCISAAGFSGAAQKKAKDKPKGSRWRCARASPILRLGGASDLRVVCRAVSSASPPPLQAATRSDTLSWITAVQAGASQARRAAAALHVA